MLFGCQRIQIGKVSEAISVSVDMKMSSSAGTSNSNGHELNGQLSYQDVHIAPFLVTIVLFSCSASNV